VTLPHSAWLLSGGASWCPRFWISLATLMCLACKSEPTVTKTATRGQVVAPDSFISARATMVERQLRVRDIEAPAVLSAMAKVERHRFVPAAVRHLAYDDHPLPIASGQTISQPYIVAYMTQAADIAPTDKVLEIGTGSGYQAAVLGELAREVYTIEIIPGLADSARAILTALGYKNVHVKAGNGYLGWPEHAPFDAIVVTAAPDEVPQALVDQLAVGGKMVIPVGASVQEMMIIEKTPGFVIERKTIPVRFVPMTGKPAR
jgi:protein-L-isoaspartate(D-aspartate) O-methyltransferase